MGFFNKILKGLGFEEDEEKPEKVKPVKTKEKKEKLKPDFASFDLNKDNIDLTEKVEEKKEEEVIKEEKRTRKRVCRLYDGWAAEGTFSIPVAWTA